MVWRGRICKFYNNTNQNPKKMKKTLVAITLASMLTLTAQATLIGVDLISLGSSGIGPLDRDSSAAFVQSSNEITFNSTASLGDTFFNASAFGPVNWTSSNGLYIRSTITTNPNVGFTVLLWSRNLVMFQYTGATNVFTTGTNQGDSATYSYLHLTPTGSPNLSSIEFISFAFDAPTPTPAVMTLHAVSTAAVPEPSTYALAAVGALGFFLSFRRRKVQA
jgi:hypothetical protein